MCEFCPPQFTKLPVGRPKRKHMQMSGVTRSLSTRPLDVSKYFVVNNMNSDDLEKKFINDFIGMFHKHCI